MKNKNIPNLLFEHRSRIKKETQGFKRHSENVILKLPIQFEPTFRRKLLTALIKPANEWRPGERMGEWWMGNERNYPLNRGRARFLKYGLVNRRTDSGNSPEPRNWFILLLGTLSQLEAPMWQIMTFVFISLELMWCLCENLILLSERMKKDRKPNILLLKSKSLPIT